MIRFGRRSDIYPEFPESEYSEEYISEKLEFLKETLDK